MSRQRFFRKTLAGLVVLVLSIPAIAAASDPLAKWQPKFDPSTAEYTYLLSCVGHPAIEGVAVGFSIRDRVWEASNGRLYVDFRPLSQLGGEKDVINKLKFGAVQGMMSSSVAAANIAPQLGIVNLPYVVDTFDKLEKFRITPELWETFRDAPLKQNLQVLDVTGYGSYGWATNSPVTSLKEAGKINFRIAQAPVNIDVYKNWELQFTVMPWPDVPQALQTGVITGLDHTPIVCNISKKFTIARNYTQLDYAQGLYVHIVNTKWLKSLPEDLQQILLQVIREESAKARQATQRQQETEIAAAKLDGVKFFRLSEEDKQQLIKRAEPVYVDWAKRLGGNYLSRVQAALAN